MLPGPTPRSVCPSVSRAGMHSIGSVYWKARLRKWPSTTKPIDADGYTLLVPVPGDLPAFLDLALAVCGGQDLKDCHRTVVIPDRMTGLVSDLVHRYRETWAGPLDILPLPSPERWFLPYLRSGSRNHGMQLVTGASAAATSHVILHDADLFPAARDFFDSRYRTCKARDLACLGVSGVWDPWYAARGLRLAATWDLCASTSWLRSHRPADHIGHDGRLFGETHTFDTTLLPQALTPAELIDHTDDPDEFVHFNYVISSYRHFQRQGQSYYDDRFRLLFVAVVSELLGTPCALPSTLELASYLGRSGGPLIHPTDVVGHNDYKLFRERLQVLVSASWVEPRTDIERALRAFDRYYGVE